MSKQSEEKQPATSSPPSEPQAPNSPPLGTVIGSYTKIHSSRTGESIPHPAKITMMTGIYVDRTSRFSSDSTPKKVLRPRKADGSGVEFSSPLYSAAKSKGDEGASDGDDEGEKGTVSDFRNNSRKRSGTGYYNVIREKKVDSEMTKEVKEWCFELYGLTCDPDHDSHKVTKQMLDLRMAIDLAKFGEPLTGVQEEMLRVALKMVKMEQEEWEEVNKTEDESEEEEEVEDEE